jgi:hypothetical protein
MFTRGNNPWIDAITYNARWSASSLVPLYLRISILQPSDQSVYDLGSLAWYESRSTSGAWITDGNPIGKVSKPAQRAIKEGYRTWSDVANIQFEFIDDPMQSDVFVTFAKYINGGVKDNGRVSLGSHSGLLVTRLISAVDTQFGVEIGDRQILGSNPEPSTLPLALDLNYHIYRGADRFNTSFLETIIHEVGHGIGMSHPHDSGLGSVPSGIFPGLQAEDSYAANGTGLFGLNQNVYTIMSSNSRVDSNGSPDEVYAVTPMALETLSAQIKYGINTSTRAGDDVYSLYERTLPDRKAWTCIWDSGGTDTISAKGLTSGVVISLRPAEMNTERPETGMPQEQYAWPSAWSDYRIAIDYLVNSSSSQPGALLGSGIRQAFIFSTLLEQLAGYDREVGADLSGQMKESLGRLSDSLLTIYEPYGFNAAYALLERGEFLPDDAPKAVKHALASSAKELKFLRETLNLEFLFEALPEFIETSSFASISIDDYFKGLSDAEKLQADIQLRSAKGVAGYLSELRRNEVSNLLVSERPGGGFTIAAGVTIENAIGGKGDDVITGNSVNNRLSGKQGDDLIHPYIGSNRLNGGAGVDTANLDSGLGDLRFQDLLFEQGEKWLKVVMGDSGEINRLKNIEFVQFAGETYSVESLL